MLTGIQSNKILYGITGRLIVLFDFSGGSTTA